MLRFFITAQRTHLIRGGQIDVSRLRIRFKVVRSLSATRRQSIGRYHAKLKQDRLTSDREILLPRADVHVIYIGKHVDFRKRALLAETSEQIRAIRRQRSPLVLGSSRVPHEKPALP